MAPPSPEPSTAHVVTTRTYVQVIVVEVVILLALYWFSTYFG